MRTRMICAICGVALGLCGHVEITSEVVDRIEGLECARADCSAGARPYRGDDGREPSTAADQPREIALTVQTTAQVTPRQSLFNNLPERHDLPGSGYILGFGIPRALLDSVSPGSSTSSSG